MAKKTGFLEFGRVEPSRRPVEQRTHDFGIIEEKLEAGILQQQATRCMDCGVPMCHAFGCPLNNRVPDWIDRVYHNQWDMALELLHETNNFPDITGRICPSPCEAACTLYINDGAVTIRQVELSVVERGWAEERIKPQPAPSPTGKKVAVIGSGPAGLTLAQQLARYGHEVIVFERTRRIGGLLRYGIPDFKLEKIVIDRRIDQMRREGVQFETQVDVGVDISMKYMKRTFDAMVIAIGATEPRRLDIPGRNLRGIHYAMDHLVRQNLINAGEGVSEDELSAKGKRIVIIGGGDTGSDCVGTCRRQGAGDITQIEILPQPPAKRLLVDPWPKWPNILRTSSSHEEGCDRIWSCRVKEFLGKESVEKVRCSRLVWDENDRKNPTCRDIPDSEFEIKTDLVLLATGFVQGDYGHLVPLGFDVDKGKIRADANGMTSVPGVFAAGDCVTGPSLVAMAMRQGRQVATGVHQYLANGQ